VTKRKFIEQSALRAARKALAAGRIDGSRASLLDLRVQTMRPSERIYTLVAGLAFAGTGLTLWLRDGSVIIVVVCGIAAVATVAVAVVGCRRPFGNVLRSLGEEVGDSIVSGIIQALF
jgi:hypothetical protein